MTVIERERRDRISFLFRHPRWSVAAIGVALFLFASLIILVQISNRPGWAYNWETYTLWEGIPWWEHPSWNALDLTDGLMTDSGRSWWVLAPVWIMLRFGDLTLGHIRIATGLVAALAVPLTWLFGREIAGSLSIVQPDDRSRFGLRTGVLAALLLPLLPSWLLYARTATLVGLSTGLAVLSLVLMLQVRRFGRYWWFWLLAVQISLLLNSWAYAPIRFLYLLAVLYFVVEACFDRSHRVALGIAALVTLVSLPALIELVDDRPSWQPVAAVQNLYRGRGEQLLDMRAQPESFHVYLRIQPPPDATTADLERALLKQNSLDLVNLLIDRHTKSAFTDYWNNQGRLIPWFLTPFLLLGIGLTLRLLWRNPAARLLHLGFWGFTLPMIATSKVHIGRLVFAIPLICIFVAIGIVWLSTGLMAAVRAKTPDVPRTVLVWAAALPLLVVLASAWTGWNDYHALTGTPREYRLALLLEENEAHFQETGGVVWVFGGQDQAEIEAVNLATTQIAVYSRYQFVNLALGQTANPDDPRVVVYYGGVIDRLRDPALTRQLCALPWLTPQDGPDLDHIPVPCKSAEITLVP